MLSPEWRTRREEASIENDYHSSLTRITLYQYFVLILTFKIKTILIFLGRVLRLDPSRTVLTLFGPTYLEIVCADFFSSKGVTTVKPSRALCREVTIVTIYYCRLGNNRPACGFFLLAYSGIDRVGSLMLKTVNEGIQYAFSKQAYCGI